MKKKFATRQSTAESRMIARLADSLDRLVAMSVPVDSRDQAAVDKAQKVIGAARKLLSRSERR